MDIKLVFEYSGKRYELVEGHNKCNGCAFFASDECPTVNNCRPCKPYPQYMIWKEVK